VDLFEIVRRATGEESEGKVVELASTAEELDGFVEMMSRFGAAGEVRAAERKMVEADAEEVAEPLGDYQCFCGPATMSLLD
jgi:hypothetical protein